MKGYLDQPACCHLLAEPVQRAHLPEELWIWREGILILCSLGCGVLICNLA